MKKIVFALVMCVCSMAANAQMWVGGSFGISAQKYKDYNKTYVNFGFAPEFGYKITDKFAIGGTLGFSASNMDYVDEDDEIEFSKPMSYTLTPFARYTFAKAGIATFFADGGFTVGTESVKDWEDDRNIYGIIGFGVRPGVSIELSKHFSIEAKTGFLGYRYSGMNKEHNFGFGVNNEDLEFGLVYEF